jgi:YggT family protein
VSVLGEVLFWIGSLLGIYWYVLVARMIMSLVLAYSQYRPSGAAAVVFEFVYTVTDPPLRLLRRFIPDLRIGSVSLDLSFLVLIFAVRILSSQLIGARYSWH